MLDKESPLVTQEVLEFGNPRLSAGILLTYLMSIIWELEDWSVE